MTFDFELHPQAENEYLAAIEWYELQAERLGEEFSQEVEKSFDRILANPERYRLTDKILRVIRVDRFPYSIFYHWDSRRSQILVTSVFHHRRRPDSLLNRIRSFPESPE